MIDDLESQLLNVGLCLDSGKSEWSHNLAVNMEGLGDFTLDINMVHTQLKREAAQIVRQMGDIKYECNFRREAASSIGRILIEGDPVFVLEEQLSELSRLRAAKLLEAKKVLKGTSTFLPVNNIYTAGTLAKYCPPSVGFVLLGCTICGDGRSQLDVERRIGKAWEGISYSQRQIFEYQC